MVTKSGMRVTHKGWFWFCPVYIDLGPEPLDDSFGMEERWFWLAPAFWLALQLEQARIFVTSLLAPGIEPAFGVVITDEIRS